MDARFALPLVNFLMADVAGGLGPFLSTWLKEVRGWNPGQIGVVIAVGSIVGAIVAGPAGAMVDRLGRPRLMLVLACVMILAGTLALLPFQAFMLVVMAQVIVAAGGALGVPATTGLTLSVVGKDGFSRQHGTNEAANHAGNVAAALAIGGLAWVIGPMSAVVVLAAMALATIGTLWLMDAKSIDGDRMRGRKRREKGEKRGATRGLLKDRRLWTVFAVIGLFQLGSSAMLPLLGQRVIEKGGQGTSWMSTCVIVAQLTMIPVAVAAGRLADRVGRRMLLIVACAVVTARCALAVFATGNYWLIPIEILDGLAAATFSVAIPVVVADLTYGTGRTQTAMGGMAMMLAGGSALASLAGGFVAQHMGYEITFAAMGVFPILAIGLLFTVTLKDEAPKDETPAAQTGAGNPSGNAAAINAAA